MKSIKVMNEAWTPNNGKPCFPKQLYQILCETSVPRSAVQASRDCVNTTDFLLGGQAEKPNSEEYCAKPKRGRKYAIVAPAVIAESNAQITTLRIGGTFLVQIDTADLSLVMAHKWRATKCHYTYYAYTGTGIAMHRLILGILNLGRKIETDHLDGDGLNNTRKNIRVATRSVNMQNRRKFGSTSSKYRGVKPTVNGKRWLSRIYHNSKPILLGTHDTEEQAARAYDAAAIRLFGPDARLNFPLPCPIPLKAA